MSVLFQITLNVILPIFALIGVGAFLHRKFHFDMKTLSKLNTFLFMPAVCFTNVYQSKIKGDTLLQILSFLVIQSLCLMIVSAGLSKIAKFESSLSATFKNSVVLFNSGNFGLPVSQFVFQNNPLGLSIQIVVLIFQNLITYTYGLFNSVSVDKAKLQALREFFRNPVIYAFLLGVLFHVISVRVPDYIWTPVKNTSNAFLAVALVTLGAQCAFLKLSRFSRPLVLSLIGRLILSPFIALLIIFALKLDGTIAQSLFIASSFPTSRNSSLFALEYGNHPEYAAQAVLVSTVFSIMTVTTVIFSAQLMFA
ncbi:putative permease [Bacillus sp. SORGH_AS 510]|uniref:AEC family transporter n=1 Tax=Bacillus sp. SORGH_AS_0510 TaxID=3041771 RepID=UPI0027845FD7|nr:AEC family transporter [Bacillus sp. SORGH_AS_0510]MDQ1143992.1 putative permease [Bacillus sp. SORGH_AS_0510]